MKANQKSMDHTPYKKLIVMIVLSFFSMYILMYSMVDSFADLYSILNQFYMAALMIMPMIIIEIAIMGSMYMNKKMNVIILAVTTIALIGFFSFIRFQTGVADEQFLKSMIPHHSGAILMCSEADIQDPELKALCKTITEGQRKEI